MADMVKDKRLEGISDIREESDRSGMRIVIEVKKDASPQVVLNTLYKHTNLQISDGINLLALVNKGTEPKVMNLREILVEYLDHQKEVIVRRTKFDLNKTEERAHIVAGLVLALANVDEVIAIIKASADKNEANVKLCSAFELDEKQANAILEMRLQRLTSLEVEKLEEELASLRATIADLQDILAHDERVWAIIKADLLEIKEKYPSPRKTQVDADESDLEDEDLIEKEDVVVSITHGGYAKRLPVNEYKAQNRGGVGITAHKTKEEDFVEQMFVCSTHDHILLFSDKGRVYHIKCYMIPEAAKTAKGRAIVNIVPIAQDEKIVCTLPVEAGREKFIAFATRKGLIKKTAVEEFMHINRNGKIAIQLLDDDALISVLGTQGNDELMIATAKGKCIRFSEENVRPMGRDTRGVKAMKLADDDKLVDMLVVDESKSTLTVTANGYGKRTSLAEYRVQGRAGKGIRAGILNEQTGDIVNLKLVSDEDDVILITTAGIMIRIHASDISKIGRSTKGVRVMRVREGEIATVAVTERDEEAEAVAPEETVTPEQAAEMAAEEGDGTEE
jgi:DNA gyrase subunit A